MVYSSIKETTMTKKCCICKNDLDIINFKKNSAASDGFQHQCIQCHKEYRKNHYIKNREKYRNKIKQRKIYIKEWLENFKKNIECIKCGEKHIATLDFHHIDPTKKDRAIGKTVERGYSIDNIKKEISKCIILCSNCHRILHWEERQKNKNKSV